MHDGFFLGPFISRLEFPLLEPPPPQDEYGDVGAYFSSKADLPHIWGVQYVMRTWPMGEEFFWLCKKVCVGSCCGLFASEWSSFFGSATGLAELRCHRRSCDR